MVRVRFRENSTLIPVVNGCVYLAVPRGVTGARAAGGDAAWRNRDQSQVFGSSSLTPNF